MPELKLGTTPEAIEQLKAAADAAAVPLTRGDFIALLLEFQDSTLDETEILVKLATRWGIPLTT